MKRILNTQIQLQRENGFIPAGMFAYFTPNSDSDPTKGRH